MRHILSAIAAIALLLTPALAAADTFAFNPVDSVVLGEADGYRSIAVTGRTGSGESTTIVLLTNEYPDDAARARIEGCHRQAVIAMSKPGRWRFTAVGNLYGGNHYYVQQCGLTRID
jgi:hypothetical protein